MSKHNYKNGHSNPSNWIWGVFYFNREDKRIFVPKRIAVMGWTINFANATSILVFAAIIFATILLIEHFK